MLVDVLSVIPKDNYVLHLTYKDGVEGDLDLSNLKDKGVFKFWNIDNNFNKVYIDIETGAIAWSKDLDICPDNAYLQITGKSFNEYAKN